MPTNIWRTPIFNIITAIVLVYLCDGCASAPQPHKKEANNEAAFGTEPPPNGKPSIYYIGETAILTFDPNKKLTIPINGADLFQSKMAWSIRVDGAVPAIRDQDYVVKTFADNPGDSSTSLGKALIEFQTNYTSQLKDGDTLTINASIFQVDNERIRKAVLAIQGTENAISNALVLEDLKKFNDALIGVKAARDSASLYLPNSVPKSKVLFADTANVIPPNVTSDEMSEAKGKLSQLKSLLDLTRESVIAESISKTKFPALTSGFRTFQLYSVDGFRNKFLRTRLAMNEIKAFPLPDAQTAEIFGNKVLQHFYVVAFSAQNDSGFDKIINSGLINAYGRAIVYDIDGGKPAFTIPVQVPPESLQQVYSIVSGTKWARPREWIFRSLSFGGGLATAIATGFGGSPDLIKALGVYSGVGIPSLQQLWPDQIPNYLANIVSYGMPELVKIPQNGSLGYKLLFFSKDNLHSMISDPSRFGPERGDFNPKSIKEAFAKPETFVVYLSFDTLEVPFEVLSLPTNGPSTLVVNIPQPPPKKTNDSITLTAVASGLAPFRYQWLFNDSTILRDGTNDTASISGAISANLILSNLKTNNAGKYSVQVIDAAGTWTNSSAVELKIQ